MSERVMWENCPNCRRLAAVGWLDGNPTRVDCPNGCDVDPSQVVSTFHPRMTRGCPSGPPMITADDGRKNPLSRRLEAREALGVARADTRSEEGVRGAEQAQGRVGSG